MSQTYLSFIIEKELFAINVAKVLEVLQKQPITQVPNAPEYIRGIINFRGEVVPVFETRVRFHFPSRSKEDNYVIIVLDLSNEETIFRIGAIVDKVKDVINIDDSEIKPVPLMSKDFNTEFIYGVYKTNDDEFLMILNVEKLFTTDDYQEVAKVQEQEILS
ncbi:MAG TPA: chemotaxis protein CheW [Bacteroidales bacterium]|nr:chemotaxis protein CheW [Bacteroidales bacterium]HOK99800.1 chemotaxis protein CheW [Bacteroidales bacterium]HPO64898.1 chemotaxis protein CheW [Bacteroidales bacterium]